tara:strand:+ start:4006 stop:5577 length:1572 start_codon:yes stop_codon:yes gene_type:complete
MSNTKFKKPEYNEDINPVDYYNANKHEDALEIFEKSESAIMVGSNDFKSSCRHSGSEADIHFNGEYLLSTKDLKKGMLSGTKYTPFMILSKYKFKGNHGAAYQWVGFKFLNAHIDYLRVGVDYFKKITATDRFGINRTELKRWNKDALNLDYGKQIFPHIPRFDTFVIEPNNEGFSSTEGNMYNLYREFSHKPLGGEWIWTERLMRHVWGEQYDLGMKYMQCLYLHPKKVLPILVMASKTRSTGKSTVLDWMSQIFGGNMVVINPEDLSQSFNSAYSLANIVGIEETVTDKSHVIEKLKNLSTTKFINVNQKFVDNYKVPFFGKFIITTNDEKRFMRIDDQEIRFWIRRLNIPEFKNTNINEDLVTEIPAFLAHLRTLPPLDFSKSRMLFTPDEIRTDSLKIVMEESRSTLFKDIVEIMMDYFDENESRNEAYVTPKLIKDLHFSHNSKCGPAYIRQVLVEEFKLEICKNGRYNLMDNISMSKTATPYLITRESVGMESLPKPKKVVRMKRSEAQGNLELPGM